MSDLDLDRLLDELGVSLDETLQGSSAPAPANADADDHPDDADPAGAVPDDPARPDPDARVGTDHDADARDAEPQAEPADDADDAPPPDPAPTPDGRARSDPFADLQEPGLTTPSLRPIYDPGVDPDRIERPDLAAMIAERGVVDKKILSMARTVMKQSPGLRLLDALRDQGADERELLTLYAESLGVPFKRLRAPNPDAPDDSRTPEDPDVGVIDGTLVQRLGPEYCKNHKIAPIEGEPDRALLATASPDDLFSIEDARLRLGARAIALAVATTDDILKTLEPFAAEEVPDDFGDILHDIEEGDVLVEQKAEESDNAEEEAAEGPVIRLVNYIIQTALKEGASDIHIEPGEQKLRVRFRIDGVLFEMMQPTTVKMAPAITSRLKIMANLDISERRIPQDGRIRCTVMGRKMDLRMSTLPSSWGEKTVLRILDQKSISVSLDDLGFDENSLTIWRSQIEMPHGVVLVTGPTGSGKTTTLYASLRAMDKSTRNISTVEDPIEYQLEGITQTGTHDKIGMTFAKALKALLRQDPDIIMVGEIRDIETAQTAIQAALTGHLVLSTLHTNDAPSSITRLVNIGIEPFLLGAAVNATLAQRLVRRICKRCTRPAELTEETREFFEMQGMPTTDVVEGAGCDRCRNLGYAGRLGLYELLVVDDHLRDIIARNPNVTEFRRTCCERGMVTLREDGFQKVLRGQTTVQEVLRVTEASI